MDELFDDLKTIMAKHEAKLEIVTDKPGNYYLNSKKPNAKGKPVFFGMVKTSKKKVAFHLMPIYDEPSLLADISPELKKKMQGKSCFNFTKQEPELLKELEALTQASFESYVSKGKA